MRSKGKGLRWLEELASSCDTDECVAWPFSARENGYAQLLVAYKRTTANRVICAIINGPPPSNSHQAAHECGNRICCNPRHISWKTPMENSADKKIHGTQPYGEKIYNAKITNEQASEIKRRLLIGEKQKDIASFFNIKPIDVSEIKRGLRWRRA